MQGDPPPRALVIGIGNEYRGDDAVGLLAARHLREVVLNGVMVLEHDGDGTRLMQAWTGAAVVIIIDAAHSGGPPGTIHRFEASISPIPASYFRHSTHAFGLVDAVELGRTLQQLPDRLIVYGIESRNFEAGTELSADVADSLNRLVSDLVDFLKPVSDDA
jgi:hydrogenase maturation protease